MAGKTQRSCQEQGGAEEPPTRDYLGAADTAGSWNRIPNPASFLGARAVLRAYKLNCVKIYICFGILWHTPECCGWPDFRYPFPFGRSPVSVSVSASAADCIWFRVCLALSRPSEWVWKLIKGAPPDAEFKIAYPSLPTHYYPH